MIRPLFICHGSPELAIQNNEYTRLLLELGKRVRPKAIVIFTAHWESHILTISSTDDTYDMIYDFGGFARELYSIKYPARGSSTIAERLQFMLESRGIQTRIDENRGLDHGSWVVLKHMYPEADIPVIQVSVNPKLLPEKQYEIGRAIQQLGEEDVLVIGSGGTVHNLFTVDFEATESEAWAVEFDDWLIEKVQKNDMASLFAYRQLAPHGKRAVPSEEHFVPLFIILGCRLDEKTPQLLHRSYDYGTLSYICFEC